MIAVFTLIEDFQPEIYFSIRGVMMSINWFRLNNKFLICQRGKLRESNALFYPINFPERCCPGLKNVIPLFFIIYISINSLSDKFTGFYV